MNKKTIVIAFATAVLCLTASCKKRAEDKSETKAEVAEEQVANEVQAAGKYAPDFTLTDINGNELALSSLKGKYLVMDFWGSWCRWCIKGMPDMKQYYAKYSDRLEILGIDCRDTEEDWRKAVSDNGITWLHVRVPEGNTLTSDYDIQGYPTKIILDPEGRIVRSFLGEDPEFYSFVDSLLAQ